jgi:hypothetical protein
MVWRVKVPTRLVEALCSGVEKSAGVRLLGAEKMARLLSRFLKRGGPFSSNSEK